MSYYQKIETIFAGKKPVMLLTAVFFTLTSMAQVAAKFTGEWKLNESKSELVQQFPLCIFGGGDRMRSKIMKIAGYRDFLTVDVASSSADGALVTRQEKVISMVMKVKLLLLEVPGRSPRQDGQMMARL